MSAAASVLRRSPASRAQLAYLHQAAHAAWIEEGRPGPSEREWYRAQLEDATGFRSTTEFPRDRRGKLHQPTMDAALARFCLLAGLYEAAARHATADAARLTTAIRRLCGDLDRLDPGARPHDWAYCRAVAAQGRLAVGPTEMDTPTNTLRWIMQCLAVHVRRRQSGGRRRAGAVAAAEVAP